MHEEPGFFAEPRNWVIIAFVLFFVLFGRKLWSALAKMLDDRAAKVRTELDEAARLRREAEAMLREAETRRAEALREAQALVEGAKAEAERVAAAAASEAEASARRREQMALDRIAAAEKAAVDEVRHTAAEVATAAARQVIAEGLSAEADSRLIDHAIELFEIRPGPLAVRRAEFGRLEQLHHLRLRRPQLIHVRLPFCGRPAWPAKQPIAHADDRQRLRWARIVRIGKP